MEMDACSIFTLKFFKGGFGVCVGREDRGRARADMCPSGRKAFDLADGHAPLCDATSQADASLSIVDREERPGMASGEAALLEEFLNRRFEFEQADGVGDCGPILSGAFSDLLLREMEFVDEALEGVGLLDRVEILALEIFDQRHFKCEVLRDIAKDDRNAVHIGTLGGTPTAFPGNELVAIGDLANDERLNDTA